jgi:hypothetical protein
MNLQSSILIFLLFSFAVLRMPNNHEKNLIGTWRVVEVDLSEMLVNLSDEEREIYELFLPLFEETFLSLSLSFDAYGKFMSRTNTEFGSKESVGAWDLSDDGSVLTTFTRDNTEKMMIEKLSETEMRLILDANDMIIKLRLEKQ